ncbi:MAG: acyltransferase domain-containing protein [Deltaproteobacteria bacterium]|nr:acyltransferase domain-containing protein [Deltaproteobacteria bacterium]
MTVAFLFPGDAGDALTVRPDIVARSPWIQTMIEIAAGAAGVNLPRLVLRQERSLARAELFQPTLIAVGLGTCCELLAHGVRPAVVAGHALGELAAWTAAGVLRAEAAIHLAAVRGHLMAREARRTPGGLATLGAPAQVRHALRVGRQAGVIGIAAHNAPHEWLLSGSAPALHAVSERFPTRRLTAAGAWQGPVMDPALDEWRAALEGLRLTPAHTTLVRNATGRPALKSDWTVENLAEHLVRPVRWARTLHTLLELGVTDIVTIGPGRALRDLVRQNIGDRPRLHSTEEPGDLERVAEVLMRRPQASVGRGAAMRSRLPPGLGDSTTPTPLRSGASMGPGGGGR